MYMAYSTNPHLPRVRMDAVRLVRAGWSTVKVARHLGYSQSVIVKWCKRAPDSRHARVIPTASSRPYRHPQELDPGIVARIIALRRERHQCAEILHHRLTKEGVAASLSSVKRTLKRNRLVYPSQWKKWHQYPERPLPEVPGILVEIDSVQEGAVPEELRAYALIDVCSRWGYAEPIGRSTSWAAAAFLVRAAHTAPFPFRTIQTDHGSEFAKWFTKRCVRHGLEHRHSRVRTPTDNARVERFIQTLQKHCLHRIPHSMHAWRKEIPEFLHWYNYERPHMALGMKTPVEMLKTIPSY